MFLRGRTAVGVGLREKERQRASRELGLRFRENMVYLGASFPRVVGVRLGDCYFGLVGTTGAVTALEFGLQKAGRKRSYCCSPAAASGR